MTEFVLGSIRETVPSRLFATHAAPSPKAIPSGRSRPDRDLLPGRRIDANHLARGTLARPQRACAEGEPIAATWSVLVDLPLFGSILVIVPSPVFATQTEPAA